jgi:hypothetical protein
LSFCNFLEETPEGLGLGGHTSRRRGRKRDVSANPQ